MTAGLLCPSCGASYRQGFTECHSCHVALVDAATYAANHAARGDPRAELADKKLVPIVHAGLSACREIERALLEQGVPCFLDASADEGDLGAPGALKVGVLIAEDDLARAGAVLRARFEGLVAQEGIGSFKTEAIDLSADEVECPACGHKGALKDGECADCGLFLGAPG
jgi:hypothetical protein